MKNFALFLICLTIAISGLNIADAYGGIRVQKDYRFTTQQDRNQRIKVYYEYLKNNGIFEEKHHKIKKDFEAYKEDKNSRENLRHIKHGTPLPSNDYRVIPHYYQMADKVLANYSVVYDIDPSSEYIYNPFGHLHQVAVLTGEINVLPYYKTYYAFNGYLQKISFFGYDGYEYIFLANGNLQGVVVNGKLYNRVGRPQAIWLQ